VEYIFLSGCRLLKNSEKKEVGQEQLEHHRWEEELFNKGKAII
jgi:hypothetical protein